MGQIVNFNEKKRNITLTDEQQIFFNNIKKEINNVDFENISGLNELSCKLLVQEFNKIMNKINNNLWLNQKEINNFIEKYSDITDYDDYYYKLYIVLNYLCITDLTKGKIFLNNTENLKKIIEVISDSELEALNDYKKVSSIFSSQVIIDLINKKVGEEKNDCINLCIEGTLDNKSAYEIKKIDKMECEDVDVINLNEGILTIEKIHKYYNNSIKLFENTDLIEESDISNINKIINLKSLSNSDINKYIYILNDFRKTDHSLCFELKGVSNLTEIFINLKNNIDEYDINFLENLFAYETINRLTFEECLDFFDGHRKKGI